MQRPARRYAHAHVVAVDFREALRGIADIADRADGADIADSADSADRADGADIADSADRADGADIADSADRADIADSAAIADITLPDGTIDAYVVALLGGRPFAAFRVPAEQGVVRADSLIAACEANASDALIEARLAEGLRAGLLRGTPSQRTAALLAPSTTRSRRASTITSTVTTTPTVTVCVCTRDRPEDVRVCLQSIVQMDGSFDVLVIDNASKDARTADVVAEFPSVRYVREERPGLDWARNRGILEATTDAIAFTDDDVAVSPGWANAIAAAFDDDPDVMCVTGLVLPKEMLTDAQVAFESIGGFGRGFRPRWFRADLTGSTPRASSLPGAGNFGTGANMAYRRSVFAAIGLFDPALDVGTLTGGGGDLEMFYRVLKAGWALRYAPTAFVWHRHRRTMAELERQLRGNGGVVSMLQASARRFPDERRALGRTELSYLRWWHAPHLLRAATRPTGDVARLIAQDAKGHLRNLRERSYEKASVEAERITQTFGPQPGGLPAAPEPIVLPTTDGTGRIALRRVRVDRPIEPISDVAGYATVRVLVEDDHAFLGMVDIRSDGRVVSRERVLQALAAGLGVDLVAPLYLPPAHQERERRRAKAALAGVDVRVTPADRDSPDAPEPARPARYSPIKVSIVISTFDRPEPLERCLRALGAALAVYDAEVIVVDNHPASGATAPVAHAFDYVTLIEEPRPGLSFGRNAGIRAAHGEVILMTDDDVVVEPNWIERIVAPFARADVLAVTGLVLPASLEEPAQAVFEAQQGLGKGFARRDFDTAWFDEPRRRAVPTWDIGATANAAFRADVFHDPAVGLFDEALGAGSPTGCSEDTLAFYRILKRGGTIVYVPDAVVWHEHRMMRDALREQMRAYYRGNVAYNLTTLLEDRDTRGILQLAHIGRWQATRARTAVRRRSLHAGVWWAQTIGALEGPYALMKARRRARRLRNDLP